MFKRILFLCMPIGILSAHLTFAHENKPPVSSAPSVGCQSVLSGEPSVEEGSVDAVSSELVDEHILGPRSIGEGEEAYDRLVRAYYEEEEKETNQRTLVESISVEDLVKRSRELAIFYYWMNPQDRDGQFYDLIMSDHRLVRAFAERIHPVELFGILGLSAFKEMTRFLDEIPTDRPLTPEILREAHRLSSRHELPFIQILNKFTPFGSRFLFQPGTYKAHRNRLVANGLTETQIRHLRGKLDELSAYGIFPRLNSENRRDYSLIESSTHSIHQKEDGLYYGWFWYPSANIVEEAVEDIFNWANKYIQIWKSGDHSQYDPFTVAVVVKHALLYIHPFIEGNGRTVKGIRDKILEIFEILPERRINLWHDLDMTIEQDVALTKLGLERRLRHIAQRRNGHRYEFPPSAADLFSLPLPDLQATPVEDQHSATVLISEKSAPTTNDYIYLIGDEREKQFILTPSGFFSDFTGVVYTLIPSQDDRSLTMVPLTEATLMLYGFGAELQDTDSLLSRKESSFHRQLADLNVGLATRMRQDPNAGRSVHLVSYRAIKEANDNGEFYFYDWQKDLVHFAATIPDDPIERPEAVLFRFNNIGFGRISSQYESDLKFKNRAVSHNAIIAHAMRLDMLYRQLNNYVTEYRPEWLATVKPLIEDSRRKIHQAVRIMCYDLFYNLRALFESDFYAQNRFQDHESWEYLRQRRDLIGLYQYLRHTHFWEADFDQGLIIAPDDRAIVLRVASKNRTRYTGLIPEYYMGNVISHFPFFTRAARALLKEMEDSSSEGREFDASRLPGSISSWIAQKIHKDPKTRVILNDLVNRLLANPYNQRGLEIEFDREFVLMRQHWINIPPQQGVSTTTSPLMTFSITQTEFINSFGDSNLYVLSLPLRKVRVAFASTFTGEEEVTVRKPVFHMRGFPESIILYESPHVVDGSEQRLISPEEALQKNIQESDLNHLISPFSNRPLPLEAGLTIISGYYPLQGDWSLEELRQRAAHISHSVSYGMPARVPHNHHEHWSESESAHSSHEHWGESEAHQEAWSESAPSESEIFPENH